jgi:hypothetical protein
MPGATDIRDKATIFGFVEWNDPVETELAFNLRGGGGVALEVQDTLIVYGDLSFANDNDLVIEEGGVLIVYGNLSATNKIEIAPNGYLIVQGDLDLKDNPQTGTTNGGDNIFVGGTYPNKDEFGDTEEDSALEDEDGGLDDFYKGKDPNNADYSINPDTTDICSRSNQEVTLYFSGGNKAESIGTWQISSDGNVFSEIADTEGLTSYTVTSTQTRYYRVQYVPEGGTESTISDTAVVYCNNLCTMTASIPEPNQTACYAEDVSINYTSAISNGTSPYTYHWEITSSDDPNVGNIITQPDDVSDQITYSNFPNPEAVSWNYEVTLTVTDADGCSANTSQTITLQRRPVTGNAYYVPNDFDQQ